MLPLHVITTRPRPWMWTSEKEAEQIQPIVYGVNGSVLPESARDVPRVAYGSLKAHGLLCGP